MLLFSNCDMVKSLGFYCTLRVLISLLGFLGDLSIFEIAKCGLRQQIFGLLVISQFCSLSRADFSQVLTTQLIRDERRGRQDHWLEEGRRPWDAGGVAWHPDPPEDLDGPDGVLAFLEERFLDLEFSIVGCVTTLPDTTESGVRVEGTGGRHDFLRSQGAGHRVVRAQTVRLRHAMVARRVLNNQEDIYPLDFRITYPSDA